MELETVSAVLWRRLDAQGHDACRLVRLGSGWRLDGAAVFRHDGLASGVERAFHPSNISKILIDPFLSDNLSWTRGGSASRAGEDSTQGGGR